MWRSNRARRGTGVARDGGLADGGHVADVLAVRAFHVHLHLQRAQQRDPGRGALRDHAWNRQLGLQRSGYRVHKPDPLSNVQAVVTSAASASLHNLSAMTVTVAYSNSTAAVGNPVTVEGGLYLCSIRESSRTAEFGDLHLSGTNCVLERARLTWKCGHVSKTHNVCFIRARLIAGPDYKAKAQGQRGPLFETSFDSTQKR